MITYQILSTNQQKEIHKNSFIKIYETVFNRKLDDRIWQHQFINSPFGNSPLFIAIEGNDIIGTALMILQKLKLNNKIYSYFLFTTSAVMSEYRVKGVYAELLNLQKEYAKKYNIDFILAFPNKNAYPILKHFGRFKSLKEIQLVKTSFNNINIKPTTNNFFIDKNIFKWRFEHKDYKFYLVNNQIIIYKLYDKSYDILAIYDILDFPFKVVSEKIPQDASVNTILDYVENLSLIEFIQYIYVCYYPLNKNINYENIVINLLMSDVF